MRPEIKQLHALLAGGAELSAPELAKRMKCSLPTVYRRLYELAREALVVRVRERIPKPGPTPSRYRLARPAADLHVRGVAVDNGMVYGP